MTPPVPDSASDPFNTPVPNAQDATVRLRAEQSLIIDLFAEFDRARSVIRNKRMPAAIRTQVPAYAKTGKAIWFPAAGEPLKDRTPIPSANRLDMHALSARIAARKAELLAELARS